MPADALSAFHIEILLRFGEGHVLKVKTVNCSNGTTHAQGPFSVATDTRQAPFGYNDVNYHLSYNIKSS
jgi:hypothetical protein